MGIDKVGIDKVGIDKVGRYHHLYLTGNSTIYFTKLPKAATTFQPASLTSTSTRIYNNCIIGLSKSASRQCVVGKTALKMTTV